jgi:hypothetical protein
MEGEIAEARDGLSKSMIELVSKIKNALADKSKIVGSNESTQSQIFLQITDLTKKSAQIALKIKACPSGKHHFYIPNYKILFQSTNF